MHFDRLCGIAERHMPELLPMLRLAKLFKYPATAKDVMWKLTDATAAPLVENFKLPFPVTAVEGAEACVILIDLTKDQIGLVEPRGFVVCTSLAQFDGDEWVAPLMGAFPRDSAAVHCGKLIGYQFSPSKEGDPVMRNCGGSLDWSGVMSKHEIVVPPAPPKPSDTVMVEKVLTDVSAAMEEILYFQQELPVLTPAKGKHRERPGGVLRSHDRPQFTTCFPRLIQD
jgi:hypothetical protein